MVHLIRSPENSLRRARDRLLSKARSRHGSIVPCGSWDQCFTVEDGRLYFWYNTTHDNSTHLISQVIEGLEKT